MKAIMFPLLLVTMTSPVAAQTVYVERQVYEPVPEEVRTFVIEEDVAPVQIREDILVGEVVPSSILIRDVPDTRYGYVVVNEQRLIVEPQTRRVISIVEY